jgi:antirestriction protein
MTNLQNCLDTCSVYVGTYKKYNEGSSFGKWLNLSNYSDYEELQEAMCKLHKDEQAPEFMFQDYECSNLFKDLGLISECYISEDIYDVANAIDSSNYDLEVLEAFAYCFSENNIYDIINKVNECYYGEFNHDAGFVQHILEETGDLPELPNYIHIDWERTSFDIMMDYSTSNNHYFRNY